MIEYPTFLTLWQTIEHHMEELTATLHNSEKLFRDKQRPWRYFRCTEAYLQDIVHPELNQ